MGRGEVVPNPSGSPTAHNEAPTPQMIVENAQAQANQRSGNAGRAPSRCRQAAVPWGWPGDALRDSPESLGASPPAVLLGHPRRMARRVISR
jgi:hypothetical protein